MEIKYPLTIDTPEKRFYYLQRLFEIIKIEGNKNKWTEKYQEALDIILSEINKYKLILRQKEDIPADKNDIIGW